MVDVAVSMAFLIVQWILYLVFMSSRPGWYLSLCGPNLGWETINQVWFWALVLIKGVANFRRETKAICQMEFPDPAQTLVRRRGR